MDMKKKLEDTYNPDKQARKEKIVIALSGGIDSFVMAYLLKIQKYDLNAVTVVPSWEDYPGEQDKVLSCHITPPKLELIREFTQKLGIPLHVIKSTSDFRELVAESWLSSKLSGAVTRACWHCHDLRMQLLFSKMQELGAKKLATGHYAKLFQHEAHNSVFVHTSNDEEHDQSGLLSRLPHEILSHLVLPLSDLTRKEVIKLGENFGVTESAPMLRFGECFPESPELISIIEKRAPKKYLRGGELVFEDMNVGSHEGVYQFTPYSMIEVKEGTKLTRHPFGSFNWSDRKLTVVADDFFLRDKLLLRNCRISEEVSLSEPLPAVVLLGTKQMDCWIYPKNLSAVYLELQEAIEVRPGQIITVLKKKGKNSKVYLTGEAYLLPIEKPKDERERNAPKLDYLTDF